MARREESPRGREHQCGRRGNRRSGPSTQDHEEKAESYEPDDERGEPVRRVRLGREQRGDDEGGGAEPARPVVERVVVDAAPECERRVEAVAGHERPGRRADPCLVSVQRWRRGQARETEPEHRQERSHGNTGDEHRDDIRGRSSRAGGAPCSKPLPSLRGHRPLSPTRLPNRGSNRGRLRPHSIPERQSLLNCAAWTRNRTCPPPTSSSGNRRR